MGWRAVGDVVLQVLKGPSTDSQIYLLWPLAQEWQVKKGKGHMGWN